MLTKGFNGTPSPTRTDMNRSSTNCESIALGLKPLITLTFIVSINVLYQCFFFKICKNISKLILQNIYKTINSKFCKIDLPKSTHKKQPLKKKYRLQNFT